MSKSLLEHLRPRNTRKVETVVPPVVTEDVTVIDPKTGGIDLGVLKSQDVETGFRNDKCPTWFYLRGRGELYRLEGMRIDGYYVLSRLTFTEPCQVIAVNPADVEYALGTILVTFSTEPERVVILGGEGSATEIC